MSSVLASEAEVREMMRVLRWEVPRHADGSIDTTREPRWADGRGAADARATLDSLRAAGVRQPVTEEACARVLAAATAVALSVQQPWPWAILHPDPALRKTVENRTWAPRTVPDALWIHASASPARAGWSFLRAMGLDVPHDLPAGAIVGAVDVAGICSRSMRHQGCDCGPWAAYGQHHWRFTNPRPLPEPVRCRGALGLWAPDLDVADLVVAQLRAEPHESTEATT